MSALTPMQRYEQATGPALDVAGLAAQRAAGLRGSRGPAAKLHDRAADCRARATRMTAR